MNKDLQILDRALNKLKEGFSSFPDTLNDENANSIESVLMRVANKMQDNYPYFQANYAGQMLKPPHAVARLAYMLAMYINPNNHALDGSRASSPMEKDCIDQLAAMFGWSSCLGHLTSGGTMANLEALWVAGKHGREKLIVSSELAHYTHERISDALGLHFKKISADKNGRMDLEELESLLKTNQVGTVVVTLGTTGLGTIDPLVDILLLRDRYDFRIHVDAAYGGYFKLASQLDAYVRPQFDAIYRVDSIVVDPHKHGLQPYGCGCILFKDLNTGRFYKHDSPYTYFTSASLHLGEISLECSRAGAAAVALWATMELYPLKVGGEFSKSLDQCQAAAMKLYELIHADASFIPILKPDLDIVVWGVQDSSLSKMSARARYIFDEAAKRNLHLALIQYPAKLLPAHWSDINFDQDQVTCLRSCLMKAEHFDAVDNMWQIIKSVAKLNSWQH